MILCRKVTKNADQVMIWQKKNVHNRIEANNNPLDHSRQSNCSFHYSLRSTFTHYSLNMKVLNAYSDFPKLSLPNKQHCLYTFSTCVRWLLHKSRVSVLFLISTLRKCVCTAFQLTIDLFTCFLILAIVHAGLYPVWTLRLLGTMHCFNYPIGNPRVQEPLLL